MKTTSEACGADPSSLWTVAQLLGNVGQLQKPVGYTHQV
jgi:hypothetical protein